MPSIQLITPHSQEIKRKWHILFHFHPFSLFPFHSLLSFSLVSQLFLPFTPFLFLSVTTNCRSEHIFYHPLFSFFPFFTSCNNNYFSVPCSVFPSWNTEVMFYNGCGRWSKFWDATATYPGRLCNLTGMPLHPHRKARSTLWFSIPLNGAIPDSTQEAGDYRLNILWLFKLLAMLQYHREAFKILNVIVVLCSAAHYRNVLDPWRVC